MYVKVAFLRKHGMSLHKVDEEVGCAVNTVRSHLKSDVKPRGLSDLKEIDYKST
jgi:predicted transcriptional regulator